MESNKYRFKNQINTDNQNIKERLEEIKFYLVTKELKKQYGDNMFIDSIIESVAMLESCKISNIRQAIDHLNTPIYKPTNIEITLLNPYNNVNIRVLTKVAGMAFKTFYNATEQVPHIEPNMKRTLDEPLFKEIVRFNEGFRKLFSNLAEIVK